MEIFRWDLWLGTWITVVSIFNVDVVASMSIDNYRASQIYNNYNRNINYHQPQHYFKSQQQQQPQEYDDVVVITPHSIEESTSIRNHNIPNSLKRNSTLSPVYVTSIKPITLHSFPSLISTPIMTTISSFNVEDSSYGSALENTDATQLVNSPLFVVNKERFPISKTTNNNNHVKEPLLRALASSNNFSGNGREDPNSYSSSSRPTKTVLEYVATLKPSRRNSGYNENLRVTPRTFRENINDENSDLSQSSHSKNVPPRNLKPSVGRSDLHLNNKEKDLTSPNSHKEFSQGKGNGQDERNTPPKKLLRGRINHSLPKVNENSLLKSHKNSKNDLIKSNKETLTTSSSRPGSTGNSDSNERDYDDYEDTTQRSKQHKNLENNKKVTNSSNPGKEEENNHTSKRDNDSEEEIQSNPGNIRNSKKDRRPKHEETFEDINEVSTPDPNLPRAYYRQGKFLTQQDFDSLHDRSSEEDSVEAKKIFKASEGRQDSQAYTSEPEISRRDKKKIFYTGDDYDDRAERRRLPVRIENEYNRQREPSRGNSYPTNRVGDYFNEEPPSRPGQLPYPEQSFLTTGPGSDEVPHLVELDPGNGPSQQILSPAAVYVAEEKPYQAQRGLQQTAVNVRPLPIISAYSSGANPHRTRIYKNERIDSPNREDYQERPKINYDDRQQPYRQEENPYSAEVINAEEPDEPEHSSEERIGNNRGERIRNNPNNYRKSQPSDNGLNQIRPYKEKESYGSNEKGRPYNIQNEDQRLYPVDNERQVYPSQGERTPYHSQKDDQDTYQPQQHHPSEALANGNYPQQEPERRPYSAEGVEKKPYPSQSVEIKPYPIRDLNPRPYSPQEFERNPHPPAELERGLHPPVEVERNPYPPQQLERRPYPPQNVERRPHPSEETGLYPSQELPYSPHQQSKRPYHPQEGQKILFPNERLPISHQQENQQYHPQEEAPSHYRKDKVPYIQQADSIIPERESDGRYYIHNPEIRPPYPPRNNERRQFEPHNNEQIPLLHSPDTVDDRNKKPVLLAHPDEKPLDEGRLPPNYNQGSPYTGNTNPTYYEQSYHPEEKRQGQHYPNSPQNPNSPPIQYLAEPRLPPSNRPGNGKIIFESLPPTGHYQYTLQPQQEQNQHLFSNIFSLSPAPVSHVTFYPPSGALFSPSSKVNHILRTPNSITASSSNQIPVYATLGGTLFSKTESQMGSLRKLEDEELSFQDFKDFHLGNEEFGSKVDKSNSTESPLSKTNSPINEEELQKAFEKIRLRKNNPLNVAKNEDISYKTVKDQGFRIRQPIRIVQNPKTEPKTVSYTIPKRINAIETNAKDDSNKFGLKAPETPSTEEGSDVASNAEEGEPEVIPQQENKQAPAEEEEEQEVPQQEAPQPPQEEEEEEEEEPEIIPQERVPQETGEEEPRNDSSDSEERRPQSEEEEEPEQQQQEQDNHPRVYRRPHSEDDERGDEVPPGPYYNVGSQAPPRQVPNSRGQHRENNRSPQYSQPYRNDFNVDPRRSPNSRHHPPASNRPYRSSETPYRNSNEPYRNPNGNYQNFNRPVEYPNTNYQSLEGPYHRPNQHYQQSNQPRQSPNRLYKPQSTFNNRPQIQNDRHRNSPEDSDDEDERRGNRPNDDDERRGNRPNDDDERRGNRANDDDEHENNQPNSDERSNEHPDDDERNIGRPYEDNERRNNNNQPDNDDEQNAEPRDFDAEYNKNSGHPQYRRQEPTYNRRDYDGRYQDEPNQRSSPDYDGNEEQTEPDSQYNNEPTEHSNDSPENPNEEPEQENDSENRRESPKENESEEVQFVPVSASDTEAKKEPPPFEEEEDEEGSGSYQPGRGNKGKEYNPHLEEPVYVPDEFRNAEKEVEGETDSKTQPKKEEPEEEPEQEEEKKEEESEPEEKKNSDFEDVDIDDYAKTVDDELETIIPGQKKRFNDNAFSRIKEELENTPHPDKYEPTIPDLR